MREHCLIRKRQNKNVFKDFFLKDLKFGLSNDSIFSHLNNEFKEMLHYHAPTKQTELCGNTKPHLNKILGNEIMKRSRLKNKTCITGSKEDLKLYKFQRSVATKLNKSLKEDYFKEKLQKGKKM